MASNNYQSPLVEITLFQGTVFLAESTNGEEGIFRDKWEDTQDGGFY